MHRAQPSQILIRKGMDIATILWQLPLSFAPECQQTPTLVEKKQIATGSRLFIFQWQQTRRCGTVTGPQHAQQPPLTSAYRKHVLEFKLQACIRNLHRASDQGLTFLQATPERIACRFQQLR